MQTIESYETLAPLLSRQLRKGVRTNAFSDPDEYRREIAAGRLAVQEWDGGLLLLHRRTGFQRLNFYLYRPELPDLKLQEPTVLEIAHRPQDEAMQQAVALWRDRGFQVLFERVRMQRPRDLTPPAAMAPDVRLARLEDQSVLETLMDGYYDKVLGCLPERDELAADIRAGAVLCAEGGDGQIIGMLHLALGRTSTEMRHFVVKNECRRQGIAQRLFDSYQAHTQGKRSLVWVLADNRPAVTMYEKNGFRTDGWTSTVLYYDVKGCAEHG